MEVNIGIVLLKLEPVVNVDFLFSRVPYALQTYLIGHQFCFSATTGTSFMWSNILDHLLSTTDILPNPSPLLSATSGIWSHAFKYLVFPYTLRIKTQTALCRIQSLLQISQLYPLFPVTLYHNHIRMSSSCSFLTFHSFTHLFLYLSLLFLAPHIISPFYNLSSQFKVLLYLEIFLHFLAGVSCSFESGLQQTVSASLSLFFSFFLNINPDVNWNHPVPSFWKLLQNL